MAKYTFKLMLGGYEEKLLDSITNIKTLKRYTIGELIHTDRDLAARFGAEQFLLVSTNGQASPAVASVQVPPTSPPTTPTEGGVSKHEPLENKTVAELQAIAEEEEIDLDGAKVKADIIKALRWK